MNESSRKRQLWLAITAVVCAAGTWLYAERVLIPEQISYAAARGMPRGHNSDLYPRWLGARELLLHGRDPYQFEITKEIQIGMYGRLRPPDEFGNGKNYQQGFYYPVYVAFLLAPTLDLPFESVRRGFTWVLLGGSVLTIVLWLRLLHWKLTPWELAATVVFTLGSMAWMQGLFLQQMTLVVTLLITIALTLLALDWQYVAGVLLAMATIKPQQVWLVVFWLAIWTLADWRRRYRWAVSFLLAMAALCAASEYYLPHWIGRFLQALREYRAYTGEKSVVQMLLGPWGQGIEILAIGLMAWLLWRRRRVEANSEEFAVMASLALAITVLVVPSYHPYNQALMLPAVLVMLKGRRTIWQRSGIGRVLFVIAGLLVVWPWLTSVTLTLLSFILPVETVEKGSLIPIWSSLGIPVGVAATMLVWAAQRSFGTSEEARTS